MKIIDKENIKEIQDSLAESTFIYPTDTIYGIGCDASNEKLVQKIREIKHRSDKPFSVIAPSKSWILENCYVNEKQLEKLPGHYTLILKIKNPNCIAKNVSKEDTLGVRITVHWFSDIVSNLGFPIITTSVNQSGENFMTSLDDLNEQIKNQVDFIIYEGKKESKPSTILDFTKEKETILRNV